MRRPRAPAQCSGCAGAGAREPPQTAAASRRHRTPCRVQKIPPVQAGPPSSPLVVCAVWSPVLPPSRTGRPLACLLASAVSPAHLLSYVAPELHATSLPTRVAAAQAGSGRRRARSLTRCRRPAASRTSSRSPRSSAPTRRAASGCARCRRAGRRVLICADLCRYGRRNGPEAAGAPGVSAGVQDLVAWWGGVGAREA